MWRNGRLAILRGWCSQGREGSNPSMVTKKLFIKTSYYIKTRLCLTYFTNNKTFLF